MLASESRSFVLFKPKVKLKADKHEVLCKLESSIGKNVGFNEELLSTGQVSSLHCLFGSRNSQPISRSRVSIWI